VTTPTIQIQTLEGRESLDRAARLQRRFYQAWQRQGQGTRRVRVVFSPIDGILVACLTLCMLAIGMGLDRMYPVVRPSLTHAIHDDLPVRPFPDCADAHDAGVFDIPAGSPAYTIDQDPDRDGLACEQF
jgi:hypothetical protein